MDAFAFSSGSLAALVIAVGFAAGLNVYATVFTLGVLARLHWVMLPGELASLQSTGILVATGLLFAGEFVADKIPVLDVVWSALHTFVRIPVAAVLAYSASAHLSPGWQVLVTCVGMAFASIAHGGKTALRVAVTASPEPFSNIALSTIEDGFAIGLAWVALYHPLATGAVVVVLSVALVVAVRWSVRLLVAGLRPLFARAGAALSS